MSDLPPPRLEISKKKSHFVSFPYHCPPGPDRPDCNVPTVWLSGPGQSWWRTTPLRTGPRPWCRCTPVSRQPGRERRRAGLALSTSPVRQWPTQGSTLVFSVSRQAIRAVISHLRKALIVGTFIRIVFKVRAIRLTDEEEEGDKDDLQTHLASQRQLKRSRPDFGKVQTGRQADWLHRKQEAPVRGSLHCIMILWEIVSSYFYCKRLLIIIIFHQIIQIKGQIRYKMKYF